MAVTNQKKPVVNQKELDRLATESKVKKKKKVAEKLAAVHAKLEGKKVKLDKKPVVPPVKPEPKQEDVDYKTKFRESSKEAMVLRKQLEEKKKKQKEVKVNSEFMKKKYPDWEDMTDSEQKLLINSEKQGREIELLKLKDSEFNNDRKWGVKVDKYIEDELADVFPNLRGKEEEFKKFATRPTRKGLPLEDLAKIFLFETPKPKKKRSLFSPAGGADKKPVKPKLTVDDIRTLRKHDNRKYMQLIREGKINIDL